MISLADVLFTIAVTVVGYFAIGFILASICFRYHRKAMLTDKTLEEPDYEEFTFVLGMWLVLILMLIANFVLSQWPFETILRKYREFSVRVGEKAITFFARCRGLLRNPVSMMGKFFHAILVWGYNGLHFRNTTKP